MRARRFFQTLAAVVLVSVMASGALAQGNVQDRLAELEKQVKTLLDENTDLRSTIDDLKRMASREEEEDLSDSALEIRSQIEQMLESRGTITELRGDRLLYPDGGFVDRLIFSGESRTRADVRVNTADLLEELDDEGFRLDYRFNLGIGFRLHSDTSDPDDLPVNVKTWIEFQSAGRAANNTAEDIRSGIGVSIGDFATRENELDVVRLYQAYVLLENILGVEELNLKAGRQELTYGSQLVLGTNEFFTGTVHDAVRLDFRIEDLSGTFSAFYAKEAAADGQVPPGLSTGGLIAGRFRSSGDEDEMMGIYSSFDPEFLDPVRFDLYYVYFNARSVGVGVAPSNVTSPSDPAIDAFGRNTLAGQIHTLGLWLRGEDLITDGLFLSLEIAYQLGNDEADQDLNALLIEFAAEFKLPFLEEVDGRIYASYYFAEGPDSGLTAGFSPLFISRHNNDPLRGHGAFSRFGNVDLIPTQNIHVIQVGLKFRPWEAWTVGLTYLYAFFNHSREPLTVNAIGNVFVDDRQFGHEIDLYARYALSRQTDVFFNISFFIPRADFIIDRADATGFQKFDTELAFGAFAQIQVRF